MDQMLDKKLHELGDYSIEVPRELSAILLTKIEEEQKNQSLEKTLKELKQHISQPEESKFNRILLHLPYKPGIVSILRNPAVAAAIAGIILSTWGISKLMHSPPVSKQPETVLAEKKTWEAVKEKSSEKAVSNNNKPVKPAASNQSAANRKIIYLPQNNKAAEGMKGKAFFAGTGLENPAFFAFANYVQSTAGDGKKDGPAILNIDSYSTLQIPEKMTKFMKALHKLNKRGKASAKAKRASRRLQKIKKQNDVFFNNKERNPADVIDLGNFIFDNM
ncbi:MAG: hypothetical protein WAT19_12890 [Ferruginibacter sp.]